MQERTDARLFRRKKFCTSCEALLNSQEQLVKRQQDDVAKFEKILDTWESQQKQ